jgi:hypothetical protein
VYVFLGEQDRVWELFKLTDPIAPPDSQLIIRGKKKRRLKNAYRGWKITSEGRGGDSYSTEKKKHRCTGMCTTQLI